MKFRQSYWTDPTSVSTRNSIYPRRGGQHSPSTLANRAEHPNQKRLLPRLLSQAGQAAVSLLAAGFILVGALSERPLGAEESIQFNRDVRPILTDTCFNCHGPDSASRKAGLRIDIREEAIDFGVWVPGDPDASEGIFRVETGDQSLLMPPPESHKEITKEQQAILRKWVAQGAEYEPHWAFIPPTRPDLPAVAQQDWVRNPIDAFVLARLEAMQLSPAAEADRYTLARRVSLDLTGLPPTPEQVREFVDDERPDAYERYVDRLLASKQWGEHRGRYWLDAARYADTHGIHFDNYREIWAYRDWVISAFNRNLPFDQFTIENLAGDLLPNPTLDQQVASGFNRCNITTNEGGVIPEEYLVLYTRDRTETVAQVWMGLTAGCAVCHDHKFDPLSQREFYEMAAFFNNTTQGAMDGNIKDTPPVIRVPLSEDRQRYAELKQAIPAAQTAVEERERTARPDFQAWLTTTSAEEIQHQVPTADLALHAPLATQTAEINLQVKGTARNVKLADSATWQAGGPVGSHALQPQGTAVALDDFGNFDRDQAFSFAAWVKLPANDASGALCAKMDTANGYRGWDFWMQGRRFGTHIIHNWSSDALKVVARNQVPANQWTHVTVTYDGGQKASGVQVYYNGNRQPTNVEADGLRGTTLNDVPFRIGQRELDAIISGVAIQDLRIYERSLAQAEVMSLANGSQFVSVLAKPAADRTGEELDKLYRWWLGSSDQAYKTASQKLAALRSEQAQIEARGTVAHVMSEKPTDPMAHVLFRGEYDQRRDQVGAATPQILPAFPEAFPRNRLGFAKWLLLPEHPLTARVTVNRFWQQVFGQGLVRTAGDFGITGELPSHPKLLDWLAVDFRESGWDVKRFFKQIVMSSTYRQAAVTTPEKVERDPSNIWLARGPRFRMDAEVLRDYALTASETLSDKVGGPSVRPYQPPGVWEAVAMIGSNTRNYQRDEGEALYRRSMYTFWKRSAPPASLETFNAPSREFCVVQRERTNTPLQALVTLNDPQFVEAARRLAENALQAAQAGEEDSDPIRFMATRVLCRPLQDRERQLLEQTLADYQQYYAVHTEDALRLIETGASPVWQEVSPSELAAYTMLGNTLLNLDEVLNK